MARHQTRRSISFNRAVYTILSREAEREAVSIAQFVTDRLRASGVNLPAVTHATSADVARMKDARSGRAKRGARRAS